MHPSFAVWVYIHIFVFRLVTCYVSQAPFGMTETVVCMYDNMPRTDVKSSPRPRSGSVPACLQRYTPSVTVS